MIKEISCLVKAQIKKNHWNRDLKELRAKVIEGSFGYTYVKMEFRQKAGNQEPNRKMND